MRCQSETRTRLVIDLRKRGILSVPMLGRYSYTRAMPGLKTHRHPGAIELCFLVRGRQLYEVVGRRYRLRGGEIFITFPGEEHGTGGEPEDKGLLYWMAVLDPIHTGDSLFGLPVADSRALWSALRHIKNRHFDGGEEVKVHFDALLDLACHRWSPLSRVTALNRLVGLLLAVLAAHDRAVLSRESHRFDAVFASIAANLDSPEELTVEKLAAVAGLSPSRFQARFKQETGIPPAEFALRARIDDAVRRLAKPGATVTSVAFELGFSSSQYFASAFRRLTNSSPKQVLQRPMNSISAGKKNFLES